MEEQFGNGLRFAAGSICPLVGLAWSGLWSSRAFVGDFGSFAGLRQWIRMLKRK